MDNKEIDIEEQTFPDKEASERDYLWLFSCGLVTAIAAFLRFFWLELKPLHHDEGVNGYFLTTLFRDGEYQYDPANYHGPDLYYLSLAFTKVFGLNTLSVRSSVAVFGVLTVVLAFCLKRYIGKTGALFAGLFLALSPGMVFISRYFIHEILFVFFSLAIVVSVVFFLEKRRAGIFAIGWMTLLLLICFLPSTLNLANQIGGDNATLLWTFRIAFLIIEAVLVVFVVRMLLAWNEGHAIYLMLASASAVLLFATKETGFITVGTMLIACLCVWIWQKLAASEAFQKSRFWIFAIPTVLAILAAIGLSGRIKEFFAWFSNEFLTLNDGGQTLVFYSIVALVAIATGIWFVILRRIKTNSDSDSEIDEPPVLTFETLREKLRAADLSEILIVKCAIGSLSVFVVWVFVRIVIEMLVGSKTAGGAMAAWRKLEFANFDYVILGFALAMLLTAAFLYRFRRPAKFSADLALMVVAAIVVFFYVGALFFSSFFTYPEGLQGAFKAYAIWTKTGNTDHTQNGFFAYLKWGMKLESPLLILSALGFLYALVRARHRFALFAGLWAFGLFAAYTIIPYKTPWLALSFLLPMCIAGGYAVNELIASKNTGLKVLGGAAAAVASVILAFQTYDINFQRYDDDSMPYVYAHTKRGFVDLIKQIEYYADKSGNGKETSIEIVTNEYWPMPWYLNDYSKANFHGRMVDSNTSEIIVAKMVDQESDVIEKYAVHYKFAGQFPLRPGVDLMLLVRNDIADSDAQDIYTVFGEPVTVGPEESSAMPLDPK
ncbi:MAG: glycosyltransferase family 39 protein [Acidobacteria bacterium]|nr:glycosyltransferase family 39 protein [Acidobacteriota bacterium]